MTPLKRKDASEFMSRGGSAFYCAANSIGSGDFSER